jgi:CRISPR-associated protein Cas5d
MHSYPNIALEVVGPAAMFTRPDTGATPLSYPVPTYSAAKGMFEAIAWWKSVYIRPTRVEICRPVRYERYITNYGGPLRKPDQIKRNNNYQLIATILVDVHYRIYAEVKGKKRSGTRDHVKELWERFNERLANGQTYYTPAWAGRSLCQAISGRYARKTKTVITFKFITIYDILCLHGKEAPRWLVYGSLTCSPARQSSSI